MQRAQEIYQKFCNGDSLTDQDVREGIKHFEALALLARQAGPVFRLAGIEARRVVDQLGHYKEARRLQRN